MKNRHLSPEYRPYTSFFEVSVYCFFATPKDVSIGSVAGMAPQVANVLKRVQNAHLGMYTGPETAVVLAFICGITVLGIGLLRTGRLAGFMPVQAVSGFMIGSTISVVAGQVPAPLEYVIWFAGVLVSIFSSIENGIYTSIIASVALLLVRITVPGGQFLGRVTPSSGDKKQSRDVYAPLSINGGDEPKCQGGSSDQRSDHLSPGRLDHVPKF
ncbi:unnamed protein product [Rhizoctonia solani]|uniref:SLC26A/SulP transporter domain-containing protein n=1 Tax=Rhizoctonia solani TaxID=456999 RepID=A0A8H3E6Y4_9AGAM|nr:unnamed protein product [Rhizoctonia solani]